jgi:hypothetical protein
LGSCPSSEDELRLATRVVANWYFATIDPAGGMQPKLFHKSDGRRIVLYRDPRNGNIKIAVEQ